VFICIAISAVLYFAVKVTAQFALGPKNIVDDYGKTLAVLTVFLSISLYGWVSKKLLSGDRREPWFKSGVVLFGLALCFAIALFGETNERRETQRWEQTRRDQAEWKKKLEAFASDESHQTGGEKPELELERPPGASGSTGSPASLDPAP
jgi:hypothetical protein